MLIAVRTSKLYPDRIVHAAIVLDDRPRARQRIVDRGDFVMQDVPIAFVEIDPLGDDSPIVLVQGNAAGIEGARTLHIAGLDLEHVVAAAPVRFDPSAD